MKILFLINFIYLSKIEIQEEPLDLSITRKNIDTLSNDTDNLYPIAKDTIFISNNSESEISNKESKISHTLLNERITRIKSLRKSIAGLKFKLNKTIKKYEKIVNSYRYNIYLSLYMNMIYKKFLHNLLLHLKTKKIDDNCNYKLEKDPELFLEKIEFLCEKFTFPLDSDVCYINYGIILTSELKKQDNKNIQSINSIYEDIKLIRDLFKANKRLLDYRSRIIECFSLIKHNLNLIYPELVRRKINNFSL